MKLRVCPSCRKQVKAVQKKCPFCSFYFIPSSTNLNKRKIEIVSLLSTGQYTLQQVGDMYGICRERIRQINRSVTGMSHAPIRKSLLRVKREIKRREKLESVRFICEGCFKPVKVKDGTHKKSLCKVCSSIFTIEQKDPKVELQCIQCFTSFHPNRNWCSQVKKHWRFFCHRNCYFKFKRDKTYKEFNEILDSVRGQNVIRVPII